MNLTEWMLDHLPAEVVDECNYYGFADHIADLLSHVWAEGFQDAADETLAGYAPNGPTDERNPYVKGK